MNKTKTISPDSIHEIYGSSDTTILVRLDGDLFNKIVNSHLMPEFMMSLTSSSDHWMFVSSNGAVTAGRRNSDNALFPYYSADKIVDTRKQTGPLTIVRLSCGDQKSFWRPFWDADIDSQHIERNIYKSPLGNKLCFEEINHELGLIFRYRWAFSHKFGFVRSSKIINTGEQDYQIDIIDGFRNIMPCGVDENFQLRFGNLLDAYKKNELTETGIGVYYLSSIPTDRAEPSEGLRATVAWAAHAPATTLLSSKQLSRFLASESIETESDIRAHRGDFLVGYQFDLNAGEEADWDLVADTELDQTDIVELSAKTAADNISEQIHDDVENGQRQLAEMISRTDGFQVSKRFGKTLRHQSNVIFNIMRGGVPLDDYQICTRDLLGHVAATNTMAADRNQTFLTTLPETISRDELIALSKKQDDPTLVRILAEYLPLVFSRRHGDPTRPWNKFSINSHVAEAEASIDYQGNWRDIFQNWEALAFSYPRFVDAMICRFLNASTADGYNPYRMTKEGFEWEKPEPNNPWANIGYWSDHQIIYLCKLLELSQQFSPGELDARLDEDAFVYANVPYRIKSFEEILQDPRDTVNFDQQLSDELESNAAKFGNDAKLLKDKSGQIQTATLAEKLLLPLLVKLSNFVPDGGVWLNTQRPEWNDANNALVGFGLSVVTVGYLRRYISFLTTMIAQSKVTGLSVDADVALLLDRLQLAISPYVEEEDLSISAEQRSQIVQDLSEAGSRYREGLYTNGLSGERTELSVDRCLEFLQQCVRMIDGTLASNRRSDGLYHSYNLLSLDVLGEMHVERLYEMLEGQVSILSSGYLSVEQSVAVLDALKSSRLYRDDQSSYMLYPNRDLPRFMEKNLIPEGLINQSSLLQQMIRDDDQSVIRKDIFGNCHFNGKFRNAKEVTEALQRLQQAGANDELTDGAIAQVASIFENVFLHHQFTGRSGTFFAYEGLGSIYWHMVSKLLLATSEIYVQATAEKKPAELKQTIEQHFREIQYGLGAEKSPSKYGAFPSDPYSHTPEHAGAQQPGMTGQVKEDILSRFIEIGIRVNNGQIEFEPSLLDQAEFTTEINDLPVWNFDESCMEVVEFEAGSFAYTFCGVLVTYCRSEEFKLVISFKDGTKATLNTPQLTAEYSQEIFARSGRITAIELSLSASPETTE